MDTRDNDSIRIAERHQMDICIGPHLCEVVLVTRQQIRSCICKDQVGDFGLPGETERESAGRPLLRVHIGLYGAEIIGKHGKNIRLTRLILPVETESADGEAGEQHGCETATANLDPEGPRNLGHYRAHRETRSGGNRRGRIRSGFPDFNFHR